ncbi:PTS sugar transporter subunit IIA [Vagococcus sp. BWB3-3]|uniref:PTS sugar transporter subunit IIA n=1 Tax=Vagococcus allomyrinae TaxID=2794353 RepID=A0A940SU77_9ENTE|nr:PTS sugar transporter subunit IIA [Vagococcus allomyrinae]MBP1041040.1 PTS sugar transporter subunit IIA [Vagococcus allomyrinae]
MTNMVLSEVLSEKVINLTLKAKTKEEAIDELSQLLFENHLIDSTVDFADDVLSREKAGVTGLGKGLAIPHGKSESVIKTSIAIGRTQFPIPWESLDDQPVTIVILFAVKNTDANTTHIKMLQNIAICLADDEFIEQLHTINHPTEMIQLFIEKEGKRS